MPARMPFPRARLFVFLLSLLFASSMVQAIPVPDLYEANVPAAGQDDGSRQNALAEALAEVLTKVSGRADVRSNPALAEALRRATSYAQTFSFVQQEDREGNPQLRLTASFHAPTIDRLLLESGMPIWGKERPQTIVWLAIEADGNRYLVSADDLALGEFLNRAAKRRGLPTSLPLLDIDDRQALSYSDVVGGFTDRVLAASQRYGGNSILVGHLRQRGVGDWDARWTHLLGGVQRDWFSDGGGLISALNSGIDGSADALAQRYAVRAGNSDIVEISVRGVSGIADYANTMNYLGGLSVVDSVQPRVVMPGQMLLSLNVKGGRQALADVIALGRLLSPDAGVIDDGSGPLAYIVLR